LGAEPYEDDEFDAATAGQARAARSGAEFKRIAVQFLARAGGRIDRLDHEIDGYPVDAEVVGSNGRRFLVLARGTPDEGKEPGLRRTDTVEKLGYRVGQIGRRTDTPLLVLTSDLPTTYKASLYLADMSPFVWDVVAWRGDLRGFHRLTGAFTGAADAAPPDAPWRRRPVSDDGDQLAFSLEAPAVASELPSGASGRTA
jgi:hypothetical protein